MFKNFNQAVKASANTTTLSSGQTRQNDAVESTVDEITVTTQKEVLADEEIIAPTMDLESRLESEGFSDKSFQMSELLQRHQILTTSPIVWNSTNAKLDIISTITFPDSLSSATFFSQKMANFAAIHAEMEVEIKINPTPFQQGALAVILHPAGHTSDRMEAWTYYPHELINLPLTNSATVKIPYLAETEAYNKDDALWAISLLVVSPLRSAATPFTLEVNAFGRYVNPKLMIPVAQAGVGKSSQNKETVDQKDGMVTKLTGIAADVLETSGTALSAIPIVGQFIPPLTWAARATNKIASYFGWSKPPNLEICKLMAPIPAARMCHAEGVDNGISLTLAPDNTTNTNTNYTDIDEMDLSYILERKFVTTVETYSTGDDFRIYSLDMLPVNTPTNILTLFKHRRWMRVFEFHFVKTAFHTGRLLIQYDYNNSINTITDARIAMSTVYSKLVDLSKQDRFIFTVPWMDINPFDEQSPGRIVVSTFNDIVAAPTVAQTLDVITYTSYRDVQVGFPTATNFFPTAQGDCCGNGAPIPTDTLIPYNPTSMVEYTMGETVSSLRLLAKRFTHERNEYVSDNYVLARRLDNSLFAMINRIYYARAGGIRFKFHFPKDTQLLVSIDVRPFLAVDGRAVQIFNGSMNNVAEISLPFYYPRRRSFLLYPWPDITLKLLSSSGGTATGIVSTYVAAGDDYNGMFVKGLAPLEPASTDGYYGVVSSQEPLGYGKVLSAMTIDNSGTLTVGGDKYAMQYAITPTEGTGIKMVIYNTDSQDYRVFTWYFGPQTSSIGTSALLLSRVQGYVFDDGNTNLHDYFFGEITIPHARIEIHPGDSSAGKYHIGVLTGYFAGDHFYQDDDHWIMVQDTDPKRAIVWNGTSWDVRLFSVDANTFDDGKTYPSSGTLSTNVTASEMVWYAKIIDTNHIGIMDRIAYDMKGWTTGLCYTNTAKANIQNSGDHLHFMPSTYVGNYFMFIYDVLSSTWRFYHPAGRRHTFSRESIRSGGYLVPSNTIRYTRIK